jgi:hypothetical protein
MKFLNQNLLFLFLVKYFNIYYYNWFNFHINLDLQLLNFIIIKYLNIEDLNEINFEKICIIDFYCPNQNNNPIVFKNFYDFDIRIFLNSSSSFQKHFKNQSYSFFIINYLYHFKYRIIIFMINFIIYVIIHFLLLLFLLLYHSNLIITTNLFQYCVNIISSLILHSLIINFQLLFICHLITLSFLQFIFIIN